MDTDEASEQSGIRARLGELSYRSGLLRVCQRMRAWLRQDLRILAYHRVLSLPDPAAFAFDLDLVSTSAEGFREQMLLLKKHFRPMALMEVIAGLDAGKKLPTNAVVVTFDDGYDDNYRVACPILREVGVPATFFVSSGHIESGLPFAHDWLVHMILSTDAAHLSLPELGLGQPMPLPASRAARRQLAFQILRRMKDSGADHQAALITRLEQEWRMPSREGHPDCRPMNWSQLREMRAAGFEIGSHGVDHRMLSKLPQQQLEAELTQSKAVIERELGTAVHLLSYPVGGDLAFNERVMMSTRAAGYDAACSYIVGTNPQTAPNRFALYRLPVERAMGIGWFAAMLTLPELMGYPTVSRVALPKQDAACSP